MIFNGILEMSIDEKIVVHRIFIKGTINNRYAQY